MRKWLMQISAFMLVWMVWTGSAAHASQRLDCIPVASEAEGHFEGDGDEWPSKDAKGAAHHHNGCGGHQAAAPSQAAPRISAGLENAVPHEWRAFGLAGRVPDHQLRPPIA